MRQRGSREHDTAQSRIGFTQVVGHPKVACELIAGCVDARLDSRWIALDHGDDPSQGMLRWTRMMKEHPALRHAVGQKLDLADWAAVIEVMVWTKGLFRTMFRTMADQKVAREANESAKALFGGTRICRARPTLGQ